MDTEYDFIQPEFLDILFFQQKNLVIFPYIDLKHLHSLEIFTVGHSVVDLESTALYNLKEIIEFEAYNSYSQNKSFYFVYNLDREKLKEIMKIADIRCALNINENVSNLANLSNFIFYNKKSKKFLNYYKDDSDLEFETYLISTSENEIILHEKIQKIKISATRIFTEINQNPNLEILPEILKDYDQKYWNKILNFVKLYFKIEVPEINKIRYKTIEKSEKPIKKKVQIKDFSKEYELIVSSNKNIGREFIQLLHDYRTQKVNPSNLDLEQLYNPQKLYNYLRNHHWSGGISEDFLFDWIKMHNIKYELKDDDLKDFETILEKLKVHDDFIRKLLNTIIVESEEIEDKERDNDFYENKYLNMKKPLKISQIPSIKNFSEFKKWLLNKIEDIEEIIDPENYKE